MIASPALQALGVELLGFSVLAIKPVPETSKALEAEARERLLRDADDAIYNRRNNAVEQERKIRENELNTEVAVETKQREIEETKLAGLIALEERRRQLVLEAVRQLDGLAGAGEGVRDLLGAFGSGDVDEEEPGEVLLRLGVRAVRGERLAAAPAVEGRGARVGEGLAVHELAVRAHLGEQPLELGDRHGVANIAHVDTL